MHRGLPAGCCSELGSTGPWAGSSRNACGAGSVCSCGSAITSYTTSSVADSICMHMKQWVTVMHMIQRVNA